MAHNKTKQYMSVLKQNSYLLIRGLIYKEYVKPGDSAGLNSVLH